MVLELAMKHLKKYRNYECKQGNSFKSKKIQKT